MKMEFLFGDGIRPPPWLRAEKVAKPQYGFFVVFVRFVGYTILKLRIFDNNSEIMDFR